MIVLVTFGEADAIGRLGRGDDHLAHAKLHGGLDHVVGAEDIGREGLVVRLQQNARDRREMHDGVRGGWRRTLLIAVEAEMRRQCIEGLPAVGQVGHKRVDARQIKRLQIHIQDRIALVQQMRHGMPPRLARSACKHDALGHGRPRVKRSDGPQSCWRVKARMTACQGDGGLPCCTGADHAGRPAGSASSVMV